MRRNQGIREVLGVRSRCYMFDVQVGEKEVPLLSQPQITILPFSIICLNVDISPTGITSQ